MWYDDIIYKDSATASRWNQEIDEWRNKYLGHHVKQTINKLTIEDYDKLYAEAIRNGAVDVPVGRDDVCIAMGGSTEEFQKTLFQSSDGNLNFIASCKCGQYRGNFYIGQICPHCKTEVRTAFADEINSHAWVTIPDSLPPFLHPAAYRILDKWIGAAKRKSKSSILDAIMDVGVDLPEPYLSAFGRGGMWYFYDNFRDIINFIAAQHKGVRAKDNVDIERFLKTYGAPTDADHPYGRLFTRHIPILDQSLHILTHSGTMTYDDESSKYILKVCVELSNTIYTQRHQPARNRHYLEQHVFGTYKSWIDYTNEIIKGKIQGKRGFIRKNILGARVHASARGVIAPITHTHMADEVELPWRMIVGLFKLEIINRLNKKFGLDNNTALDYWTQAQVGWNPDEPDPIIRKRVGDKVSAVLECVKELHRECPFKGFPIILGRNPTLRHGAIQLFFTKHFKTDPTDDTIGMSPYAISAPNADQSVFHGSFIIHYCFRHILPRCMSPI